MYYADKRQQFLIDQGYTFEVIQELPYQYSEGEKKRVKFMLTPREQVDFLTQILQNDEDKLSKEEKFEEELESDKDQDELDKMNKKERERNIGHFTGAGAGFYNEP